MQKKIKIVCKSTQTDKMQLLKNFVNDVLELNIADSNDIFNQLYTAAEIQTLAEKECKWFYCPAYQFCPYSEIEGSGIKGRSEKKKINIELKLESKTSKTSSNFGFGDGVTDNVIRGHELSD